jgi:very-short-patch-repair endonuclease
VPEINVRVGGREVDAFFRPEKLIVELDGYDYHGTRDAFERDRDRDADALADGLPTVRITWERIHADPFKEAARLRAILAQRRAILAQQQQQQQQQQQTRAA